MKRQAAKQSRANEVLSEFVRFYGFEGWLMTMCSRSTSCTCNLLVGETWSTAARVLRHAHTLFMQMIRISVSHHAFSSVYSVMCIQSGR